MKRPIAWLAALALAATACSTSPTAPRASASVAPVACDGTLVWFIYHADPGTPQGNPFSVCLRARPH